MAASAVLSKLAILSPSSGYIALPMKRIVEPVPSSLHLNDQCPIQALTIFGGNLAASGTRNFGLRVRVPVRGLNRDGGCGLRGAPVKRSGRSEAERR